MLFDKNKAFGYPVLRPFGKDYEAGPMFQPKVTTKQLEGGEKIRFDCDFAVSVKEINALVREKRAGYCVIIDCRDTFLRKAIISYDGIFSFEEEQSLLHGSVLIEKYIIATQTIENFHCQNFRKYFHGKNIMLDEGMIIAQAIPEEYHAQNELLSNLGSPIIKQVDKNLKDGEWYFEVASETIFVYANERQLIYFENFDKPTMTNVVMVPIMMEMIGLLKDPEKYGDCSEFKWAKSIEKTLYDKQLDFDSFNGDTLRLCHSCLGYPVRMSNSKFEREDT